MQLTNEKNFTAKNVSQTKPVIIIYFAPDCEHCRNLIKAVLSKSQNFRNAQVILVSFEPLTMIISFEKEFDLKKYPNILCLSLIHISEPTRQAEISYAVFC